MAKPNFRLEDIERATTKPCDGNILNIIYLPRKKSCTSERSHDDLQESGGEAKSDDGRDEDFGCERYCDSHCEEYCKSNSCSSDVPS